MNGGKSDWKVKTDCASTITSLFQFNSSSFFFLKKRPMISGSIVVPFSRRAVFNLVTDLRYLHEWESLIQKSDLAENQPSSTGLGVRYDCVINSGTLVSMEFTFECVSFRPHGMARFIGRSAFYNIVDELTFEDDTYNQGYTKVTITSKPKLRSFLRPLSILLEWHLSHYLPTVMPTLDRFIHENLGSEIEKTSTGHWVKTKDNRCNSGLDLQTGAQIIE